MRNYFTTIRNNLIYSSFPRIRKHYRLEISLSPWIEYSAIAVVTPLHFIIKIINILTDGCYKNENWILEGIGPSPWEIDILAIMCITRKGYREISIHLYSDIDLVCLPMLSRKLVVPNHQSRIRKIKERRPIMFVKV